MTQTPRHYHSRYQDIVAWVQKYGKPTLFVTFTGNPSWPEIKDELLPHQSASDRPDLVARVVWLKLQDLLAIIRNGCFGPLRAHVWVIEYQKTGLPHVHIVLSLHNRDNFFSEGIDDFISARIPPPKAGPKLHDIVRTAMVHGSCEGYNPKAPCMVWDPRSGRSKCSKKFPKPFSHMIVNENGYHIT